MLLLVISFLVTEWEVDIGVFMGKIDVMGGGSLVVVFDLLLIFSEVVRVKGG